MRALIPALLVCLPLSAGDANPLSRAVEDFDSDHAAEREAASQAVRRHLARELAPLVEAMKSNDPEVARRAREAIESLLPPRAKKPEDAPALGLGGGPGVIVLNNRQKRFVVKWVQRGNRLVRARAGDDAVAKTVKEFGVEGYPLTDAALREQLRLAAGRGFMVAKVERTAARLGLEARDIVLRIDDAPVKTFESLAKAIGKKKDWPTRNLTVLRRGKVTELP